MGLTIVAIKALATLTVALVAIFVLFIVHGRLFGPEPEPRRLPEWGFVNPIVALELANTTDEVAGIVGKADSENRKTARNGIKWDFVLIAAYWLLLVSLSVLLVQRDLSFGAWFAVLAAVCVTAAAQMDFLENLRLYTLLDTPPDELEVQAVHDVRDAARLKFGLIFVAAASLSPVFLWRTDWWLFGIGVLFVLSAAVGLLGLWQYRAAVDWAFLLTILGVLAIAVAFNRVPRESLMNVLSGS